MTLIFLLDSYTIWVLNKYNGKDNDNKIRGWKWLPMKRGLKKKDIWVSSDSAMPQLVLEINSQLSTIWFKEEQK